LATDDRWKLEKLQLSLEVFYFTA